MKLVKYFVVYFFFTTIILSCAAADSKISSSLQKALTVAHFHPRSGLSWNIIVEMSSGPLNPFGSDDLVDTLPTASLDPVEDVTDLRSSLINFAQASQQEIVSTLIQPRATARTITGFEQLWISNEVWVGGADEDLINLLAIHPDVAVVKEELVFPLPPVVTVVDSENKIELHSGNRQTPVAWGVAKVGAGEWWKNNHTGQGVLVGHIDSGARGTHRILRDSFLGPELGWFDPDSGSKVPIETSTDSHGTHTLGTAVGAEGYGMAPGAKWISCVGCPRGKCDEALVKRCAQFLLCPNNPSNVTEERCSSTPHVVISSWGTTHGGESAFDTVIQNWRRAGIIPVFSVGNGGPRCGTLGSPGDHRDVISVGSSEEDDSLSRTSSLGPPVRYQSNQVFKPDIVGPGSDIRSAIGTGDDAFGTMSGTSHLSEGD